jgi:serine/threonine-protein kinase
VREGNLTQGPGGAAAIALSPDGNVFAFTAVTAGAAAPTLHVRRLDQFSAIPLPGTEGAYAPFFSPDGQSIAFFADRKLKRIPVTGGATMTLADAPSARGGSWSDDGTIVFSPDRLASNLLRVPESGGAPEPITTRAEDEAIHRWPQVLPDGRGVLYTSHSHTSGMDNANLVVQPLPRGDRKIVLKGGYHGRYVHSGHIVYIRDSTLFAAPFDLDRLETTGPPVPVVEEVTSGNLSGSAQYAVSNNGTLLYVSGGVLVQGGPIEWMDRKGTRTPLRATSAYTNNLTFSPDGARLALDLYDGKQWDIWVYEWARDRPLPFRFDAANESKPIWTADGRRVTFASSRGNLVTPNLYWQLADGAGEAQRLTDSRNPQRPGSWHPSGRFLAFFELTPEDSWDLMILPMEGDATSGWKPGKPTAFMSSPFAEVDPVFSRDGRWLAYHSNESGRDEVTVAPFPGPGAKLPVSTGGGSHPTWSPAGDELFYIAGNRIMVVPFKAASGSLQFEKPRRWSDGEFNPRTGGPLPSRGFDLHPAGERFALTTAEVTAADKIDHVNMVLNFFDELRRLAPSVKR